MLRFNKAPFFLYAVLPFILFPFFTNMYSSISVARHAMSAEEMNPYRASILRILEAVGLERYGCDTAAMPPRTEEENKRIAEHLPSVLCAEQEKEERLKGKNIPSRTRKKKLPNNIADAMEGCVDVAGYGTRTIYLSFEDPWNGRRSCRASRSRSGTARRCARISLRPVARALQAGLPVVLVPAAHVHVRPARPVPRAAAAGRAARPRGGDDAAARRGADAEHQLRAHRSLPAGRAAPRVGLGGR
ncbi:hypothetical protein STCU_10077 [Strigomonas culicis]|uniref:Uncharacterized protein n=1 Tax=Strigomonas culicis TaxID=28005 RepID=S9V5V6_9TRYP|nr:hypothetical protein STCU_10077 [Strigomonas culicis]|eukprot:EPY18285.1 hypothetical protein STCU_10077 [Strigomonas culicis]